MASLPALVSLGVCVLLLCLQVSLQRAPSLHAVMWQDCAGNVSIPCPPPCLCYVCNGNVTVASCNDSALASVPPDLPGNTTVLLLRGNRITAERPGQFLAFKQLQWLDLAFNGLTTLGGLLQNLSSLFHLDLSTNNLSLSPSVYKEDVFQGTTNLRVLQLYNNCETEGESLDYPGRALSRLRFLRYLSMDGLPDTPFGPEFINTSLESMWFNGFAGHCNMKILRNGTFRYLPQLKRFKAEHCNIIYIENGTFLPLRDIIHLDLSYNAGLGFRNLSLAMYDLQNSSLKTLMINNIRGRYATCTEITKEYLLPIQNMTLESIHVDENRIEWIQTSILQMLPKTVRFISAGNNLFTYGSYINDLRYLTNLVTLDLRYRYFYNPSYNILASTEERSPSTMFGQDFVHASLCPQEEMLFAEEVEDRDERSVASGSTAYVDNPTAERNVRQPGTSSNSVIGQRGVEYQSNAEAEPLTAMRDANFTLPNKTCFLSLMWNKMYYDIPKMFIHAPGMKALDVSFNYFPRWIGPVEGLNDLQRLDMSYTSAVYIERHFFEHFVELRFLNISGNYLQPVLSDPSAATVFSWLTELRLLDLSKNRLRTISQGAFDKLVKLEQLYLVDNKLMMETLNINIMLHPSLVLLDLNMNDMSKLSEGFCKDLSELTKSNENKSISINLANNLLSCGCASIEFMEWLLARMNPHNRYKTYMVDPSSYLCLYPNGSQQSFDVNGAEMENMKFNCAMHIQIAISSFVGVVLCLSLAIAAIFYRYRWKVRYLYYAARNARAASTPDNFRYDAFISYAEEDSEFVDNHLIRHLEEGSGLKLCVHRRDFLPGKPIIANVVDAIQNSRRTVCLLSQNFLESYWCKYEIQMATQEGLHRAGDVVLVVMYSHVCSRLIPKEVFYFIQTDSYVEYPKDSRCEPFFWDNLLQVLRPPQARQSLV